MTTSTYGVHCGLCGAPVTRRIDTDPDGQYGCAACDNWGDRDEVIQIAKEHAIYLAKAELHRGLAAAARGSKALTYKGKAPPKKQYRFLIGREIDARGNE